jgi:superfamily I DNA/RNA helicase
MLSPNKRTPSPQQQAVIDFVRDDRRSAFVEAVAGAGKTTTLVDALSEARGSVAFVAYNKKIADDIKAKIAPLNLGNRVRAGTFHSFGLATWRRAYPGVKCGPDATREKADRTVKALNIPKPLESFTLRLMSLAKQAAIGLYGAVEDQKLYYDIVDHFDMAYDLEDDELIPKGIDFAMRGLRLHAKHAPEIVDFDDMLWMPVISGVRVWQNDVVFVDEAQDTNPCRRAYVRKMLNSRGGRAIFVGDRHQAIYGFTGADNDAVDQIVRDFDCVSLPLTVTYRCPKTVVAKAQEVVSHIQAHESAPDGEVSTIEELEFLNRATTTQEDASASGWFGLSPSDAILCRKTKPLVTLAFTLIRAGVACHVEGKDIGAGLIKLIDKFKSAKTLNALLARLDAHGERQCQKLTAKGKEGQAEALADRIATVRVIAEKCATVDELKAQITSMFEDGEHERKPTVTLSTVHKAKGREWPRVFILGRNAWMPGPWARQAWEQQQENNLIYVAYTRAQRELVLINVPAEKT